MSFYSDVMLIVTDASDEEADDFAVGLPMSSGDTVEMKALRGEHTSTLVMAASIKYIDFEGAARALDEFPWPRDTRKTAILVYDDEDADKARAMSIDEAVAFLRAEGTTGEGP